MKKIDRPKSLTAMATERVRNEIVRGRFGAGEALSVNALAETLGISRTPIREALTQLTREGLVVVIPQKGSFVFDVDRKEFADICDLRTALELPAMRYALVRDQAGLAGSLERIVSNMTAAREKDDTPAYLELDTKFHAALFQHCQNSYLNDAYNMISGKMAALRNRLGSDPDHMLKSFSEHVAIKDAVRKGDPDTALQILEGHIGRKEGSYWNLVSQPEEGSDAA